MDEISRQNNNLKKKKKKQDDRMKVMVVISIISIVLLIAIMAVFVMGAMKRKNDRGEVQTEISLNASTQPQTVIQPSTQVATTVMPSASAEQTQGSSSATIGDTQSVSNSGNNSVSTNSLVTSKGYKIEQIDGVTYIDGYLVVNKTYGLPSSFIPQNPETPVVAQSSTTSLDSVTMSNWRKLQSAATSEGLNIYIASGYRSYTTQTNLYNKYASRDGKAQADTYSARPGHSEHQTGLCFDLNSIDDSFQYTKEGQWVNNNCYKYGFIIRFPKGKENETGYMYESWHLRYVGKELAQKLYNNGDWITMEEYFGITSQYQE